MARSRTVLFSEISSAIQIRCSRLPSPSQTSQFYLLIESIKIKKIINLKLTKVKWDTSQSRVFTCGLATNANTTLLIDRINKIQDNQV